MRVSSWHPGDLDAVREVEGRRRAERGRVAVPDLVVAHVAGCVGSADGDRSVTGRGVLAAAVHVRLRAQSADRTADAAQAVTEHDRDLARSLVVERGAVG